MRINKVTAYSAIVTLLGIGAVYAVSYYGDSIPASLDGTFTFTRSGSSPMLTLNSAAAVVTVNASANSSGASFAAHGNGMNYLISSDIDNNKVGFGLGANSFAAPHAGFVEIWPNLCKATNAFQVDKADASLTRAFEVHTNGTVRINAGLVIPTNSAPTSVTVGTTAPDAWLWVTSNGALYKLAAWRDH